MQHTFVTDLGKGTFKASNGWLESFIKRNHRIFRTMSGERGDVDNATVIEWKKRLPTICENYSPKNIFNMDETGLFFKDTFHLKNVDCAGGKKSKLRITVALCASMEGEKLQPLVIGKASQPRCLKKLMQHLCLLLTEITKRHG